MGGEEDVGLVVGGGEREEVEGVGGDDVGGEEVDFGGGVGDAVVVEVAFVGLAANSVPAPIDRFVILSNAKDLCNLLRSPWLPTSP